MGLKDAGEERERERFVSPCHRRSSPGSSPYVPALFPSSLRTNLSVFVGTVPVNSIALLHTNVLQ